MACNLAQFEPINVDFIDLSNAQPGDIFEIEYVYVDGENANIVLDANADPITNLIALQALESSSLANNISGSISSSISYYFSDKNKLSSVYGKLTTGVSQILYAKSQTFNPVISISDLIQQLIDNYMTVGTYGNTLVGINGAINSLTIEEKNEIGDHATTFEDFALFFCQELFHSGIFSSSSITTFPITKTTQLDSSQIVGSGFNASLWQSGIMPWNPALLANKSNWTLATQSFFHLPEVTLSDDDKDIYSHLAAFYFNAIPPAGTTGFFISAPSVALNATSYFITSTSYSSFDFALNTVLSNDQMALIDQLYLEDFIQTLIDTECVTVNTAQSRYVFNRTLSDILNIINGVNLTLIASSGSFTSGSLIIGNDFINIQQLSRFEIQRLSYHIKRFQNSNFQLNELPEIKLWGESNSQTFFNSGSKNDPTAGKGKIGKLFIEITNQFKQVSPHNIFETQAWQHKYITGRNEPYISNIIGSNSNTHELPAVQRNRWINFINYIESVSFPTSHRIRHNILPRFRRRKHVSPYALQILWPDGIHFLPWFPLLPGGNVTINQARHGLPEGIFPTINFDLNSNAFEIEGSLQTWNYGKQIPTFRIPSTEILIEGSGSQVMHVFAQPTQSFNLSPHYDFISYQPLFQLKVGDGTMVEYSNFTGSNFPPVIAQGNDEYLMERKSNFYNMGVQQYDKYETVVYQIRKWPKILDKSNQNITKEIIRSFYPRYYNLQFNQNNNACYESYFIDDKKAGFTPHNITALINDGQGVEIDVSSSYSFYRSSVLSDVNKPYLGGITINKPLQYFELIKMDKRQVSASFDYIEFDNINPQDGQMQYFNAPIYTDFRITDSEFSKLLKFVFGGNAQLPEELGSDIPAGDYPPSDKVYFFLQEKVLYDLYDKIQLIAGLTNGAVNGIQMNDPVILSYLRNTFTFLFNSATYSYLYSNVNSYSFEPAFYNLSRPLVPLQGNM